MRRSAERILTSHVGALPGPEELWARQDPDTARLSAAVADVVRHQRQAGVDIVNEGELTKGGNWVMFVNDRLTGFEPRQSGEMGRLLVQSQDWAEFRDFYDSSMRQ